MRLRVRVLDMERMVVSHEEMELAGPGALGEFLPDGRRVLGVEPVEQVTRPRRRLGGDTAIDIAWWCRELRTLLLAGMTVVEAIDTLQAQADEPARAELQAGLLHHLQQGTSLSNAMQALEVFPMVLVASVRASERSSSLPEALSDYLRYHEMLELLRKRVVSAAIYPSLVLAVGAIVSGFLLLVVLPRFATMYADLHGQMAWSTAVLVAVSQFVKANQALLVVAGAGALAGLVWAWRSGLLQRVFIQAVMLIGPVRSAEYEFQLAKLYHAMTVMFKGGFTLDEALNRCAGLSLGGRLDQGIAQARADLNRGVKVSSALHGAGLADQVAHRLLAVGERSGNFERILQTIAERHADNFSLFMERATRIVEPLILLVVALLIGSLVVVMYLPIFDIASSIR